MHGANITDKQYSLMGTGADLVLHMMVIAGIKAINKAMECLKIKLIYQL